MSLMDIIARLRRKKMQDDGKALPWYCMLRTDDNRCIYPDLDCKDCEVYQKYARGEGIR